MYSIHKNVISIDSREFCFDYDIRDVIPYGESFIVLLGIPFEKNDINNIYCVDMNAQLLWQVEDLNSSLLGYKNYLPYEGMYLDDDVIFATDFYGRRFKINPSTGKIEGSGGDNARPW